MIDSNQSCEIALLALTPQSERQCGLAEICRADYFTSPEIAPAEFGVGLRCVRLACASVLALSG